MTVPIVNFSSLMLAPEWLRIQEKPLANWVTPAKRTAIVTEMMRQCDRLDGLRDGIINNYPACRAIFDVNQAPPAATLGGQALPRQRGSGSGGHQRQCLPHRRPDLDTALQARALPVRHPLAFNTRSFGMWLPSTDPGLRPDRVAPLPRPGRRCAQRAGALALASRGDGLPVPDLTANPLDCVEGGALNARRVEISEYLDATHPDLTSFYKQGQADRHRGHQRFARIARRAAGLLPERDRPHGPGCRTASPACGSCRGAATA